MEFSETSALVRLLLGAVATFFAILLWSRTRDTAWILVILGTLISYAEIIYSTLQNFGILKDQVIPLAGFADFPVNKIIQVALINLPLVLYTLAFIILILRRRLP
ncbi:MAG TPA: hypothetical protein VMX75_07350 [Spirochaetia bacterium]|nr:hypothetical protein [Spirochaetia bacterium]